MHVRWSRAVFSLDFAVMIVAVWESGRKFLFGFHVVVAIVGQLLFALQIVVAMASVKTIVALFL